VRPIAGYYGANKGIVAAPLRRRIGGTNFYVLIQSFTFRLSLLPQTCRKFAAAKRHGFEFEMRARREAARRFKCMEQL
jgi:hypothetical protein